MILKKAKKFIYKNVQPLNLSRRQSHFENGSKENILNALSYYLRQKNFESS